MHIRGLVSVVSQRSNMNTGRRSLGLLSLDGNDVLQKIVAWSDLCYCTSWDLSPNFPILQTDKCSANLQKMVIILTEKFLPNTSWYSPHDLFGEMADIFQVLRLLSAVMTSQKISQEVQSMFPRALYITEYRLLILLDQTDPRDDDIILDRNSHIYGSTRLAAYLYLYFVLRELPRTAQICSTLSRRMKRILSQVNISDLLSVWNDDLHLLQWIAFMGALSMEATMESGYWIDILRKSMVSMQLESESEFRNAIKEVLWIDDSDWDRKLSDIWKQVDHSLTP